MPIFRINNEYHHYAHIPKCAGTAVEYYLKDRFGDLAFYETARGKIIWANRWSKVSPQHLAWQDLLTVFPEAWIASTFAIVRNPMDRIISEFLYKRTRGTIPGTGFNEWVKNQLFYDVGNPFALDNHIRPQTDFVADHATVFKMEAGLSTVVDYLDALEGKQNGGREIKEKNTTKQQIKRNSTGNINESSLELIARFYAEDFERFRYEPPTSSNAFIPRRKSNSKFNDIYQRFVFRRDVKKRARIHAIANTASKN